MLSREGQIQRKMERFEEVCRSAGVKVTQQRIEIFRELVEAAKGNKNTSHR